MVIPKINSAHGPDTRNILNTAIDSINAQGKSIQDLVAEGQLTPTQYAELIKKVNALVSKGEIITEDLDKNNFSIDETMIADSLRSIITGNAPIHAVPADDSLTTKKYVDKSVTGEKTDFIIPNSIITDENIVMNRFLFATNGVAAHDNYNHTGYELVYPNTEYEFSFHRLTIWYDKHQSPIRIDDEGSDNPDGTRITSPPNAMFMRTNINRAYSNSFFVRRTKTDKYLLGNNVSVENLSMFQNRNLADLNNAHLNNFLDTDGSLISNSNYNTLVLEDVRGGESYEFSFHRRTVFLDENDVVIEALDTTIMRETSYVLAPYNTVKLLTAVDKTLWDDFSIYAKSFNALEFSDEVDTNFEVDYSELPEITVESDWLGSDLVGFGDSIMWQDGRVFSGTQTTARGYLTNIKDKLGFLSYENKGVSGVPMANGSANGSGTVYTIDRYTDFSDKDLVIIAAGTNDFKLNVPLGTKGEIGDATFDDTTFYGAYRKSIEKILSINPSIRIVLFTPLQRDNGNYDVNTINVSGHKLIDYVNAIIEIGEMYSVPIIDLYRNSGITKLNLSRFTTDGLHLSQSGYDRSSNYAAGIISKIGK